MADQEIALVEEIKNKKDILHKNIQNEIFSTIKEVGKKIINCDGPISGIIESQFDKITDAFISVLQSSMAGIVYALEAKDAYSCRHSNRVAIMSSRFADILHLKNSEKKSIYLAATIHDIGKIGIPDSVLLCPSRLDDEQFKIMKTHPKIGADIIQKTLDEQQRVISTGLLASPMLINVTNVVKDGILHHHERWDGKGYPENLKGEEIPFISRMIALCDSTDAMLSSRCYRKALTEDICKEEIKKNAGIMYSPDLAEVFVNNWDYIVGDLYKETDVQVVPNL